MLAASVWTSYKTFARLHCIKPDDAMVPPRPTRSGGTAIVPTDSCLSRYSPQVLQFFGTEKSIVNFSGSSLRIERHQALYHVCHAQWHDASTGSPPTSMEKMAVSP